MKIWVEVNNIFEIKINSFQSLVWKSRYFDGTQEKKPYSDQFSIPFQMVRSILLWVFQFQPVRRGSLELTLTTTRITPCEWSPNTKPEKVFFSNVPFWLRSLEHLGGAYMDLTFPNLHPLNPDICVSAWPVFYEAELPDLSPIKGFFASIDNFTMWKTWQLGQSNVGQCMGGLG